MDEKRLAELAPRMLDLLRRFVAAGCWYQDAGPPCDCLGDYTPEAWDDNHSPNCPYAEAKALLTELNALPWPSEPPPPLPHFRKD